MLEYYTKAIVLDREKRGEYNGLIHLLTADLGRVEARVTGINKITSKLSGHFQIGNLVLARLIEKNEIRLVDGLSMAKLNIMHELLLMVRKLAPLFNKDIDLFNILLGQKVDVRILLSYFGYDASGAICSLSGRKNPECFMLNSLDFVKKELLPSLKLGYDEVVCL